MCYDGHTGNAKDWIIAYTTTDAVLVMTLIAICYYFVRYFIRNTKNGEVKNETLTHKFFYIGLVYLMESIVALPVFAPYIILTKCHSEWSIAKQVFTPAIGIAYGIQLCLMEIIWFMRLWQSFKDTVLQLNKCTIRFYIIINIIGALFIFPALLSYHFMDKQTWSSIIGIAVLFYSCITISFAILFIIKLVKAHTNCHSDPNFITTITKITILTIVSVLITLISTIIAQFRYEHPNLLYTQFAWYFGSSLDIYSNALCVVLSYGDFNWLYFKLCGCTHSNCNTCWEKMIVSKQENNVAKELQANTSDVCSVHSNTVANSKEDITVIVTSEN